jgi:acyl carrier protein
MRSETLEDRVERLVLEYAQSPVPARPIDQGLSLRNDLVIESLSLVSLALRLGDELGVDLAEAGFELGDVKTVGDLVTMARAIARTGSQETLNRSA